VSSTIYRETSDGKPKAAKRGSLNASLPKPERPPKLARLLKRLRQDAHTDLVAIAVQTAPQPPDKSALQRAISRRTLTPVTSN